MKTFLLSILMFFSLLSLGQNISVSFTASGAASEIDSVRATNLTTNQSVTLPGNETLVLSASTGVPSVSEPAHLGMVFPNPFFGWTTITCAVQKPQTVYLIVLNLTGQVVAQTTAIVQPGENAFALSVNTPGIYAITLTSISGTTSHKVICTETSESSTSLKYLGRAFNSGEQSNLAQTKLKTSSYVLGFAKGDVIHYTCKSGRFITIVTDSPKASKNCLVQFVPCIDPDDKNYSIVKIGDQTWMAENLAYLPAVSGSNVGSDSLPYYYVYGFEGTNVNLAKKAANDGNYGVLYNWVAARTACPEGWHLPTDEEWQTLEIALGMTPSESDLSGIRGSVGKILKSTSGWEENGSGNNQSGFAAVPMGFRFYEGGFDYLGHGAYHWTDSEYNTTYVWYRHLYHAYIGTHRGLDVKRYGFSVRCVRDAKPITNFTVNPEFGSTDTVFQFDPSTSNDPTSTDGLLSRWDWIGDGVWDTQWEKLKSISHQYLDPGVYKVVLEVKDADGLVGSQTKTLKVSNLQGTFADVRDGHKYSYVTIGSQVWTAENLAYLPAVSPPSSGSGTTPYYYVYGNEENNVLKAKASANFNEYGVLYNWEAAKTACPADWHLPGDNEWKILEMYLGMSISEADAQGWRTSGKVDWKLKEYGTSHWVSPNLGATNSTGFTALPGGQMQNKSFWFLGSVATFWTSTESDQTQAWDRFLFLSSKDGVYRDTNGRSYGFSVRCLRDW